MRHHSENILCASMTYCKMLHGMPLVRRGSVQLSSSVAQSLRILCKFLICRLRHVAYSRSHSQRAVFLPRR